MLPHLRQACNPKRNETILHLAEITIKSIWWQLTQMWRGREKSRIGKVNSPGSGEKVLLLSLSRVVEDSRKIDS